VKSGWGALVFLALLLMPATGLAEIVWDARGFGRVLGGYGHYPAGSSVDDRDMEGAAGTMRLLADGRLGSRLGLEVNLMQEVVSRDIGGNDAALDVERSGLFTWQQEASGDYLAQLSLDCLALHYRGPDLYLTVGRQPINLATTFFFTPNDFFAPFAAQAFFRVYKPGVDGLRADIGLGELSQLSLIAVLAYDEETSADTGWSKGPDWARTSYLGRLVTNRLDWEFGLLAGTVHDRTVLGGSLQGELFDWLGVRISGHYGDPEAGEGDAATEFCLGLEHRFPNSLDLRGEYYYHGRGFASIEAANLADAAGGYLGRTYTGLAASYEFSPLLTGQALVLINWTDQSRLWSIYTVYSLTDESELSATLSIPEGDKPDDTWLNSEFGASPLVFFLEYRVYF